MSKVVQLIHLDVCWQKSIEQFGFGASLWMFLGVLFLLGLFVTHHDEKHLHAGIGSFLLASWIVLLGVSSVGKSGAVFFLYVGCFLLALSLLWKLWTSEFRWGELTLVWLLKLSFFLQLSTMVSKEVFSLWKVSKTQEPNSFLFVSILLWLVLFVSGAFRSAWMKYTAIIAFFSGLVMTLLKKFIFAFESSSLAYITVFTGLLLVSSCLRSKVPKKSWFASFGLLRTRVLTHVFLISFTVVTMYPVLLVCKMAFTPTQGFQMSLNPVPSTFVHYFEAWKQGDVKVRQCYGRAIWQNFQEVMGSGSSCHDQICAAYRQTKQKQFLVASGHCNQFLHVMASAKTEDKSRLLANWKASLLKLAVNHKQRNKFAKLALEIQHQHKERTKRSKLFLKQLLNSVFVAIITTILGIFLACTAAYAFSRFRFPGRETGLMSFLVSQMFPGTLMMIPLYLLISKLGLLNNLLGLTLVYSTTSIPFCVWMLKGYFDTIPKEIEEAALIDGASKTMIFFKIILPLSRPAIAVTALFSFMTAWNEFILAATFMNQESSYTLPVMLQRYVGAHTTEWGHFAAGAIFVSLPIVFLFYALQKYLVSGLTAGSVKG